MTSTPADLNRDTIVWGLVGGLSFLVLLTAYEIVTDWRAGLLVTFGVALAVTVAATGLSAVVDARVDGRR